MELAQASSMKQVGAITSATVIERPTAEGSVWIIEFQPSTSLASHVSNLLEVARGTPKIFKTVQAALNDVKSIGMTNTTVQFTEPHSFRANRFQWLYPWIQSLSQKGYDEEAILHAFAEFQGVRLNLEDTEAVKMTRIIIQHALGKSDGKELEAYLPPVEVLDVRFVKSTQAGYLCQAYCANAEENFAFLVSLDVSEKLLKAVLNERKAALCKLVLVAAHTRNPYGYTDTEQSAETNAIQKVPVAAFKLTLSDIDSVRTLAAGASDLVNKWYVKENGTPLSIAQELILRGYDVLSLDNESKTTDINTPWMKKS